MDAGSGPQLGSAAPWSGGTCDLAPGPAGGVGPPAGPGHTAPRIGPWGAVRGAAKKQSVSTGCSGPAPVTRVAPGVAATAPAGTQSDTEPVREDRAPVLQFDLHGPFHQEGPRRCTVIRRARSAGRSAGLFGTDDHQLFPVLGRREQARAGAASPPGGGAQHRPEGDPAAPDHRGLQPRRPTSSSRVRPGPLSAECTSSSVPPGFSSAGASRQIRSSSSRPSSPRVPGEGPAARTAPGGGAPAHRADSPG